MDNTLSDDIRDTLKDVIEFRKVYVNTLRTSKILENTLFHLQEELKKARVSEDLQKLRADAATKKLIELQSTFSGFVQVQEENRKLKKKVETLEDETSKLSLVLDKERLASKQTLEMVCQDITKKAEMNLKEVQAKNESLREQLENAKEGSRQRESDLQNKLQCLGSSKSEEIKCLSFEFQERINKLEAALSTMQAENRYIREKANANMALYQKKLVEIEFRMSSVASAGSPAVRIHPSNIQANDRINSLLSPGEEETSNTSKTTNNLSANKPKRRKLFSHKETLF